MSWIDELPNPPPRRRGSWVEDLPDPPTQETASWVDDIPDPPQSLMARAQSVWRKTPMWVPGVGQTKAGLSALGWAGRQTGRVWYSPVQSVIAEFMPEERAVLGDIEERRKESVPEQYQGWLGQPRTGPLNPAVIREAGGILPYLQRFGPAWKRGVTLESDFTASQTRVAMRGEPEDAAGKVGGFLEDLLVGFADPTMPLGFGTVTKAGKVAKAMGTMAPSVVEQMGPVGQRALVSYMGRPVVYGGRALKPLQGAANALGATRVVKPMVDVAQEAIGLIAHRAATGPVARAVETTLENIQHGLGKLIKQKLARTRTIHTMAKEAGTTYDDAGNAIENMLEAGRQRDINIAATQLGRIDRRLAKLEHKTGRIPTPRPDWAEAWELPAERGEDLLAQRELVGSHLAAVQSGLITPDVIKDVANRLGDEFAGQAETIANSIHESYAEWFKLHATKGFPLKELSDAGYGGTHLVMPEARREIDKLVFAGQGRTFPAKNRAMYRRIMTSGYTIPEANDIAAHAELGGLNHFFPELTEKYGGKVFTVPKLLQNDPAHLEYMYGAMTTKMAGLSDLIAGLKKMDGAYEPGHFESLARPRAKAIPRFEDVSASPADFFEEVIAKAQRGEPEDAMLAAKEAAGGGVLGPTLEHVGDINHRMNELGGWNTNRGYGLVREKVRKTRRWLNEPYGFEREASENAASNAVYRGIPLAEHEAGVQKALDRYAAAHEALPHFNGPQYYAKQAAIELGKRNYRAADDWLAQLESILDLGEEAWTKAASTVHPEDFAEYVSRLGAEQGAAFSNIDAATATANLRTVRVKGLEKQFEGWLFEPEMADEIEGYLTMIADPKKMSATEKAFRNLWDRPNIWWKAWTLAPFVSYHVRNSLGNKWNMFVGGFKNPTLLDESLRIQLANWEPGSAFARWFKVNAGKVVHAELADDTARAYGFKDAADLWDTASRKGVTGHAFMMSELGEAEALAADVTRGNVARSIGNVIGPSAGPVRGGRTVGGLVEDNDKLAYFLHELTDPDIVSLPLENRINYAADQVSKFLIDYNPAKLTPFERGLRRYGMPFYCVPESHEILTKTGWKRHRDLIEGEPVMVLDPQTYELRWEPLLGVATFDFDGYLRTFERRGGEFLFTEDHRWPVEITECVVKGRRYGGERKILRANELNGRHKIPLKGEYSSAKSLLSPRLAAILGWIVTDGYARWRGNYWEAMVYQSPKKYLDEIIRLLGTRPRKPHPDTGVVCVPVSAEDRAGILECYKTKTDLPSVVLRLSRDAAEAMFDAMVKAEASCHPTAGTCFTQMDGPVMEAFQLLCLLTGRSAWISGTRPCRVAYLRHSDFLYVKEGMGTRYYKGVVWCPKTPTGTWIMRNEGAVIPTGNTWTRYNLPIQVKGVLQQPGKYAALTRSTQAYGAMFEPTDERWMSPRLAKSFPMRVGGTAKKATYLPGLRTIPAAELQSITDPAGALMDLLGPIPKFALAVGMKKDPYTGTPVSGYEGQRKDLLGIGMNPYLAYALRSGIRAVSEGDWMLKAIQGEYPMSTAVGRMAIGKAQPYEPRKERAYRGYDIDDKIRLAERDKKKAIQDHDWDERDRLQKIIGNLRAQKAGRRTIEP